MNRIPVTTLRNIGPTSASWLALVGIHTRNDLLAVGAVPAFLMVRRAGFRPTLNLLWGLEGAAKDVDWRSLTVADKQRLRHELTNLGDYA